MKVGVCLFDEPKIAKSAWISIAGSKAARINGISELRSDVFWVTNLRFFEHRSLNLNHAPNIADEQFFRTKISSLIKEVSATEDPEVQCAILSKILNRTSELGSYFLNADIDGSSYRYSGILQNHALTPSMRKQPEGGNELEIKEAILQSTQENQAMSSKQFAKGSKIEPFVFPRASYAKWLLSQDYPVGNEWTKITIREKSIYGYEDGSSIRNTSHFINRLEEIDKDYAAFFRISVLSTKPNYATFAKFGSGCDIMRRWATLPELVDILRYSKVEILSGFRIKKQKIEIDERIFEDDYEYSISKGLFLENLWCSIASPVYSRINENVSAIGAYMRAYDRIACGRAAASFSNHGFTVGSYGMGRVQVSLRNGEINAAKEVAIANSLMPQMRFIS